MNEKPICTTKTLITLGGFMFLNIYLVLTMSSMQVILFFYSVFFFFSSIRSSRCFPHSLLDDSDILALTDCNLILSHSLFVSSHCRVHFRHLLALAWHELLLLWSRWNDSLLWRRKSCSFSRSYFWWNPRV